MKSRRSAAILPVARDLRVPPAARTRARHFVDGYVCRSRGRNRGGRAVAARRQRAVRGTPAQRLRAAGGGRCGNLAHHRKRSSSRDYPDMKNVDIAFIGGGHMARSLIGGLIADGVNPTTIWVAVPF